MANPNTAVYPSAVATDSDLPPVSNRWTSRLIGTITSTDASLEVADASLLNVPCIITIDNERILATGKSSNSLTGLTRGFDGSIAASHANATTVFGSLVAYHLNQAYVELKAIQTALGASLATLLAARRQVIFTTSGSWVVPAGVTEAEFELSAGGGGGGGGGAGDYLRQVVTTTPAGTVTITIGAGGTAGAANGGTAGNGGTTSASGASVSLSVTGGNGGSANGGTSGSGSAGTSSGGPSSRPTEQWNFSGGGAGANNAFSLASTLGAGQQGTARGSSASAKFGGHGGGNPMGVGGLPGLGSSSGDVDGNTGGYGSGGGGGTYRADGNGAGGVGGGGAVIIRY